MNDINTDMIFQTLCPHLISVYVANTTNHCYKHSVNQRVTHISHRKMNIHF